MLDGTCLEDVPRPFEPEDLLNALPLLAKPVIEIRTTDDLTVLEPPMSFVPGLCLFPATTIRGTILKQIGNILVERGLIVLGNQEIVSREPMDLRTQGALGMHGIQGEDAPCDQLRGQQRLERTDLMLFLLHIAVPQDNAGGDLITPELMHRIRLRCGGTQRFAINSQMSGIRLSLWRGETAPVPPPAPPRLPPPQKNVAPP